MPPHLLLFIFIPALIFESAFSTDWHIFKVEFGQVAMMAGPMLIVSTFLSACMMYYIYGYNEDDPDNKFTWNAALLYGSIISATDPVAVVALLKELGASRRLATLIEGESLLNDGTAMVVFLVLLDMVKGKEYTFVEIILKFVQLSFGGPILGIIGGFIIKNIIHFIQNKYVLEVNATIFGAYLIFYTAEFTPLHVSGILAIVAFGLYMSKSGKISISANSEHSLHNVWGYIGFLAETVIFILSGLIIGERLTQKAHTLKAVHIRDILLDWPLLHIIRFSIMLLFWPITRRIGYGQSFKEIVLCSYAGLRGAIGLSLALVVANDNAIDPFVQDIILLHVSGMCMMTLLINATTTGFLVRKLGLSKQSDLQKSVLIGVAKTLEQHIEENIEILKS